jgi:hypothetical protein
MACKPATEAGNNPGLSQGALQPANRAGQAWVEPRAPTRAFERRSLTETAWVSPRRFL